MMLELRLRTASARALLSSQSVCLRTFLAMLGKLFLRCQSGSELENHVAFTDDIAHSKHKPRHLTSLERISVAVSNKAQGCSPRFSRKSSQAVHLTADTKHIQAQGHGLADRCASPLTWLACRNPSPVLDQFLPAPDLVLRGWGSHLSRTRGLCGWCGRPETYLLQRNPGEFRQAAAFADEEDLTLPRAPWPPLAEAAPFVASRSG